MTEAEILADLTSHGDRIWSIMQYWTSISFAVLIAAHLTAARISWLVIAIFLVIYVLVTFQFSVMLRFDMEMIRAGVRELMVRSENGQLTLLSQAAIEQGPLANDTPTLKFIRNAVGLGMFAATVSYPIYCKLKTDQ